MTADSFNAASTSRDALGRRLAEEAVRDTPSLQTMKDLIAAGANLEARNDRKLTPLLAAVDAGNPGAVGLLLDSGADKYALAGEAGALFFAIAHYDLDMVRLLLDKGTDPEHDTYRGGLTALMWAANLKKRDIANEIAARGGDAYRKDRHGKTAIDYADDNRRDDIVKSLHRIEERKKELQAGKEAEDARRKAEAAAASEKAALEAICQTGLATTKPVALRQPMRFCKSRRSK